MTSSDRILRERRRSDCYRLLSACFYPPDRDQLRRDRTCLDLADVLNELYPDTEAAAHAAALQDQIAESSEVDLRVDHAALFVGPFALKAPPYGSIYLEANHALMGDTTLAAAARYAAAGLTVTLHEPADHIAVELEFMHYLATLGAQAAERGDGDEAARLGDEQRCFLTEHLGAWAPAFCEAITCGAATRFYRSLAECLRAFLEAEVPPSPAVLMSRA
jgi:TorA maturation chaperone TorD